MSKVLKTLLFIAYSFVIIQYLRFALSSHDEDIELDYTTHLTGKGNKEYTRKALKYKKNLTAMQQGYKRPFRFPTDLKYILKFSYSFFHYGKPLYANGQDAFVINKCKYKNCYFTNDVLTLADIRDYDAILFDAENSWDSMIVLRDPHQKFVFVASESSVGYPLCDPFFNDYYNLTWTYKLDSDILMTRIAIEDKNGNRVGPKINMSWVDLMKPIPPEVKDKITTKKKAAAWFIADCGVKSDRDNITKMIQSELEDYNLTVDIFGNCGTKACPGGRFEECLSLLESDYYFYFSFESSQSEDFVTERLLYPLQHYAVPVVYGGADYSRFLPPGSYINAKTLNVTQIVAEMYKAIKNHTLYQDYFRWHNYYTYSSASSSPDVCKLCQILNEESNKRFTHKNFLNWWHPNYVKVCNKGEGRVIIDNEETVFLKEQHHLRNDPDYVFNGKEFY